MGNYNPQRNAIMPVVDCGSYNNETVVDSGVYVRGNDSDTWQWLLLPRVSPKEYETWTFRWTGSAGLTVSSDKHASFGVALPAPDVDGREANMIYTYSMSLACDHSDVNLIPNPWFGRVVPASDSSDVLVPAASNFTWDTAKVFIVEAAPVVYLPWDDLERDGFRIDGHAKGSLLTAEIETWTKDSMIATDRRRRNAPVVLGCSFTHQGDAGSATLDHIILSMTLYRYRSTLPFFDPRG